MRALPTTARRAKDMTVDLILGAFVTLFVAGYVLVALLRPEHF